MPQELMLFRREEIHDPLKGARRIDRVERAEHKVAGLGRGCCGFHCFTVPHLADQNDVGALPDAVFQREVKVRSITPNLSLIDNALLVLVNVFNGIFQGNDVLVFGLIQMLDHRSQRGRLPTPGRSADQKQASRGSDQFLKAFCRQVEFFE